MNICWTLIDGIYYSIVNSVQITLEFNCNPAEWILTTDFGTYTLGPALPLNFINIVIGDTTYDLIINPGTNCCPQGNQIIPIGGIIFGGEAGPSGGPSASSNAITNITGGLIFGGGADNSSGGGGGGGTICLNCTLPNPVPPVCVTITGVYYFVSENCCYCNPGLPFTPIPNGAGPYNGTFTVPYIGNCTWQIVIAVPSGCCGVNVPPNQCNILNFTITVTTLGQFQFIVCNLNSGTAINLSNPFAPHIQWRGIFNCGGTSTLTPLTPNLLSNVPSWVTGFGVVDPSFADVALTIGQCPGTIEPIGGLVFGGSSSGAIATACNGCLLSGIQDTYWVNITGITGPGLTGLNGLREVFGIGTSPGVYCCWSAQNGIPIGKLTAYIHLVYLNTSGTWQWHVFITDSPICNTHSSLLVDYVGPFICEPAGIYPFSSATLFSGWGANVQVCDVPCNVPPITGGLVFGGSPPIAVFGAGGSNFGVLFNQGGISFATANNAGLPTGASPWTLTYWSKWGSFNPTSGSTMCQITWGNPVTNQCVVSEAFNASGTQLEAFTNLSTGNGGGSLLVGVKYWIAITYNGSIVNIYINNVSVATLSVTLAISTNALYLGNFFTNLPANVALQDIRIYGVTLNSTQLATIYNSGTQTLGDGVTGSLLRWYKTNEGSGTTLNDSGSNGNNATTAGSPPWISM